MLTTMQPATMLACELFQQQSLNLSKLLQRYLQQSVTSHVYIAVEFGIALIKIK